MNEQQNNTQVCRLVRYEAEIRGVRNEATRSYGHYEGAVIQDNKVISLGTWVPSGTAALKEIRQLNAALAQVARTLSPSLLRH